MGALRSVARGRPAGCSGEVPGLAVYIEAQAEHRGHLPAWRAGASLGQVRVSVLSGHARQLNYRNIAGKARPEAAER